MTHTRRQFLQASAVGLATKSLFGQESPVLLKARVVTQGPKHHFFGYYDKCPWDGTGRYLLAMENDFADRQPRSGEKLAIGMVDLKNSDQFIPLDATPLWSWQQGTMLQWLGSAPDRMVIYNTIVEGKPVAILRDVHSGKTQTLPKPIYAVNAKGTEAVTLDFARLHRLRPGYGYATLEETHAKEPAPEDVGIWHMTIPAGQPKLIVNLAQLAANQPDARFTGAEHWVNHLQFNPGGTRFVFLHRWKKIGGVGFTTRIYTVKPDGSDLKLLHDSGLISHFDWRDDDTVLAWIRVKAGEPRMAFALLHVDGRPAEIVFESEKADGHCSYSPNREWVLNDTYPDKTRMQSLMLLNVKTQRRFDINRFHSPTAYTGPIRCDLHPRWNRDGTQVCFDGSHDAQRQVYVVDVKDIVKG